MCAPAARSKPAAWKGGARCAVAFSFDSDHETNELRDGGGSISKLSQGQYGNRKGVPRILDILSRAWRAGELLSCPPSSRCSIPTSSAAWWPKATRSASTAGSTSATRCCRSEPSATCRCARADTLEKITGVRPVGIRTPSWDFSPNTLAITREMGLDYDSSMMADDDCYELLLDGEPTGVVELPVEWIRDDAVYFNMNRFAGLRPDTAAVGRVRHLHGASSTWRGRRAACSSSPCTRTTRGYRSRIWVLEELIQHAKARGSVWFATHADIIRFARDNAQ